MKNLKSVIKKGSSPRTITENNLQPLPSQRSKTNSQQVFSKYNKNTVVDLSKQSSIQNKYRIVTQPIDDRIMQLSKSYAKLSKSKRKQIKLQSQHNSIKTRQRTISNEKYTHTTNINCLNCQINEKQVLKLKEQIKTMIDLKDKWKNGQIIIQDFIKQSHQYQKHDFSRGEIRQSLEQVRMNMIDLMKDIEVLTQIDYPKLLSHNIFVNQSAENLDEEIEIKILLDQLRDQFMGKLTIWDDEVEGNNSNMKTMMRNLKTNLTHCIRQNLRLKTYHYLGKKDGTVLEDDIRKVVFDILRGLK